MRSDASAPQDAPLLLRNVGIVEASALEPGRKRASLADEYAHRRSVGHAITLTTAQAAKVSISP
jgi:hypothetical protein